MADPHISYKNELSVITESDLVGWTVDYTSSRATGPCPTCGHSMERDLLEEAVAMGAAYEMTSQVRGFTRLFSCTCGNPHKDGTGSQPNCGRRWLVKILPAGAAPPIMPADDYSLLAPASALATAAADEQSRVRPAAEKWIAGVAALVGLFGLSGLIAVKDLFVGASGMGRELMASAFIVAIVWAAAALALFYLAAYGWPVVVDLRDDQKLRDWFDRRQEYASAAAQHLRTGVLFVGATLATLVIAVGLVWFWPRTPSTPLVTLTLADDSSICGQLLSSVHNGQLRIKLTDGSVQSVATRKIVTSKNVSTCSLGFAGPDRSITGRPTGPDDTPGP